MNRVGLVSLVLLVGLSISPLQAREWTDASGSFRVEAQLVSVKNQKVYLEKTDGTIATVPLEKLSQADLEHLLSLAEHSAYFRANPIPGMKAPAPETVVIEVDDESIVGEVRRFGDLDWGVESLAFSPNGRFLAVGKTDRALMVFDVNTSTRVAFLDKLEDLGRVTCLTFSPDGTKLLSGGHNGQIQVWNVAEAGVLTKAIHFDVHERKVLAITIAADGKTVLSGGGDDKARCWDLETGEEALVVDGFDSDVKATFITSDGKQGLACDGNILALIDIEQAGVIQTMELADRSAQAVAISPDGSRVTVGETYALRSWDIRTGQEFLPFQDKEIQWEAVFTPNNKYLLSGGGGKVNVWQVKTNAKIREFALSESSYVRILACSPDGIHFAAVPSISGADLQVFRMPAEFAEQ